MCLCQQLNLPRGCGAPYVALRHPHILAPEVSQHLSCCDVVTLLVKVSFLLYSSYLAVLHSRGDRDASQVGEDLGHNHHVVYQILLIISLVLGLVGCARKRVT